MHTAAAPGARPHSEAAVLLAVTRGCRVLDDVAAGAGVPRMTAYGALRRLRAAGLVDWQDGERGTLHSLVREISSISP